MIIYGYMAFKLVVTFFSVMADDDVWMADASSSSSVSFGARTGSEGRRRALPSRKNVTR